MNINYDKIRPYTDKELVGAVKRISENPLIDNIYHYLYGENCDVKSQRNLIKSMKSVDDFQTKVVADIIASIVNKTIDELTYSGIENINDGKKHVLICNHRDIFLDPAIIQLIFYRNNSSITEIAVGDNLITSPFLEDICRSNRMIKVRRNGTPKELYMASNELSGYIRNCVTSQKNSVWIAQGNGRAKEGNDNTEQGLLKMLDMSGENDFVSNFDELSLLPVSISYEYEPCAFLKAREVFISSKGKYVKDKGEDFNSVLTGITQKKGRVHFHFGSPITLDTIKKCSLYPKNKKFLELASVLDNSVNSNYKLWPNNYIAYDIINRTDTYAYKYDKLERESFIKYMEKGLENISSIDSTLDINELRNRILSIYSNPIKMY
ncbi:MAG: 1-acyl-sn-glycerol-3-phosphate acyltransferase [Bacteroidales bacterium]